MTQPLQHQPRQMQQSQSAKPARMFGRQPRAFNAIPHYSAMRRMCDHAPPPPSADWLSEMPANLGMMLNGYDVANPSAPQLGDCSIAALHHARQIWSRYGSGTETTDPNTDVLADYRRLCGYDGTPATDNGGILQNVLAGAYKDGLTTATGMDRLLGYVEIDPRNIRDVKSCIASGGVVYLGINVSESFENAQPGDTISRTDDIGRDGHCIIGAGYTPDVIKCSTWGFRVDLTWEAFAAMCDEAYWCADPCFIATTGLTPGGITKDALLDAMQSVRAA